MYCSSHVERGGVQIEDSVAVAGDLRRVGFAVEHPEPATVAFRGFDLEPPRCKGEQVGRQRFGFGVSDACPPVLESPPRLGTVAERVPSFRHIERQRVSALQVRLVEAGKRQTCARWHEQRVHEVRIAIERGVSGDETERDLVGSLAQIRRSNHDVIVGSR